MADDSKMTKFVNLGMTKFVWWGLRIGHSDGTSFRL